MDEKSKNVTDHEKYVMFKNRFRPGEKYEFKKALKHGCYRSWKKEHLSECFVHSPKNDGVYSSVIWQKGESQNGCFKNSKHAKFSEKRTFLTPFLFVFRKIWRALCS